MEDVSETLRIATQNGVISIARDGVTNAKRCIVPGNALQAVNEKVVPNRCRGAVPGNGGSALKSTTPKLPSAVLKR